MGELHGNILITGGTGTLGQAIVKRAQEWNDCTLTIYSRDELKQHEMRRAFPKARYILGDVQDEASLRRVVVGHDLVIHAAAQKHIPEGELNPWQTLQTNVLGSAGVLWAAAEAGVKEVILISTDKVCHPVNTYGATKMLMERIAQAFALSEYGKYVQVHLLRYGNVLSSNGSVLQVWNKQKRTGKPITITDQAMTRFWITESMAVDYLLACRGLISGHVYIPKIKSLTMRTLKDVLYPECQHEIMGLRPGDKMHEELLTEEERPHTREFADYFDMYPIFSPPITGSGQAYTSDNCERLTDAEIRKMVECC